MDATDLPGLLLASALAVVGVCDVAAQNSVPADVRDELAAGGEVERYVRMLQISGRIPLQPWSVREFSPTQIERLAIADTVRHPWEDHYVLPDTDGIWAFSWIRPAVSGVYNSRFPYGGDDGAVWAGRGATGALRAGFRAGLGPLHVTVEPLAFLAQNRSFALAPNGETGEDTFRDPRFPGQIDFPQRFGDEAYGRYDFGRSKIELDLPGLVVGFSGAPEQWGPARRYPLILGDNAGGFLHAFVGTDAPLDLWAFELHFRLVSGKLEQSEHSPVDGEVLDRFATGVVISVRPRGVPGLELGFTRFIHTPWPEGGPDAEDALRPFTGGLKDPTDPVFERAENQLASGFFRWVAPSSGFEVYGEFARDDFALDFRQLLLEPDDLSGYLVGFAKVFARGPDRMTQLSAEIMNTELAHRERGQRLLSRAEPFPMYKHTAVLQGHTNRGQLLTSAEGYGGAGLFVRVDRYDPTGRWSAELARSLRFDWVRGLDGIGLGSEDPDVIYALELSHARFLGPVEIAVALTPALNLNRNLDPAEDVVNVRFDLSARFDLARLVPLDSRPTGR